MRLYLLLFIGAFSACHKVDVCQSKEAYMEYIAALNLQTESTQEGIQYQIQLRPAEQIGILNDAPKDSINAWYNNRFELMLKLTDTSTDKDIQRTFQANSPEYGEVHSFISTKMIGHIRLITESDTILPSYLNAIRSYGMEKNDPIIIGFDLKQELREYDELVLEYHDALFSEKILRFDLSNTDFTKTPRLF